MAEGDEVASATVRIDPDLSYFKDKLRAGLEAETGDDDVKVPIKPDIDQADLQTGIAEVDAELRRIGAESETVKIKPEVDTTDLVKAKAEEDSLGQSVSRTNASLAATKDAASSGAEGLGAMITAALTLGPALIPIGSVLLAGVAALGPMLLAAGAGLGVFALAAVGASGGLKPLEAQVEGTLANFRALARPEVLPAVTGALGLIGPIFSQLFPLVGSTAHELEHLETAAKDALGSPFWRGFSSWIDSEAQPAMSAFASLIGGIVKMFAGLGEAFSPIIHDVEQGLTGMGAAMASFGQNAASGGLQGFISFVQAEGPTVANLLTNLWGLLRNIVIALAPIGVAVLGVVTGLTDFLNMLTSLNPVLNSVVIGLGLLWFAWSRLGGPITSAANAIQIFFKALSSEEAANALAAFGGDAEKAAVGASDLVTSLVGGAGLGAALAGLGIIAGGVALAGLGIWIGGMIGASNSTAGLDAQIRKLEGGVRDLPTKTLPQMTSALHDAETQLNKLTDAAGLARTNFDKLHDTQPVPDPDPQGKVLSLTTAMGNAVVNLTAYITGLKDKIRTTNDDIGYLQEHFDLSRSSAIQLAESIGLNLNKALSPAEIYQFSAALAQQAAQTKLSASALDALAKTSGETTSQITTNVNNAVTATKQAWSSYGDAVTAFSNQTTVTGDQISSFYAQQTLQAGAFTQNVQKAIQMGFDPRLISQIIQAGPTQASALLQGLVNMQGSSLQALINQSLNAMSKMGQQAVEQARITQMAVESHSSTMASQLAGAMAIDEALTQSNASQSIAALSKTFTGGLLGIENVAKEYGIALPSNLLANLPSVSTNASAQTTSISTTYAGALGNITNLATQLGGTLSGKVQQNIPPTSTAASGQTGAVSGAYSGALGPITNLANQLAEALPGKFNSKVGDARTAGKGQGDAAGQGVGQSDPSSAANQLLQKLILSFTENNSHKSATAAGKGAADAAASGASGEKGQFTSAGVDALQGFLAGLSNSSVIQQINAQAASVAKGAVQSAKGPAGIKSGSPSKLSEEEVGIPALQGILVGLQNSGLIGQIQQAGALAARSAVTIPALAGAGFSVPAMTPTVGTGAPGGLGGGVTLYYNPNWTVSGDPDPTTLAKWRALMDEEYEHLGGLIYARGG